MLLLQNQNMPPKREKTENTRNTANNMQQMDLRLASSLLYMNILVGGETRQYSSSIKQSVCLSVIFSVCGVLS